MRTRELLAHGDADGRYWVPAMADTPLRGYNGRHEWFWEPGDDDKAVYPLENLMDMYEKSVGRNATLIVGLTPNPDGVIPEGDVKRLKEWGDEIARRFGTPLAQTSGKAKKLSLDLKGKQKANCYILQEDITQGERIRAYRVEARTGGKWVTVDRGTSVGHKRIGKFDPVEATAFRVVVEQCTGTPQIRDFSIYSN